MLFHPRTRFVFHHVINAVSDFTKGNSSSSINWPLQQLKCGFGCLKLSVKMFKRSNDFGQADIVTRGDEVGQRLQHSFLMGGRHSCLVVIPKCFHGTGSSSKIFWMTV